MSYRDLRIDDGAPAYYAGLRGDDDGAGPAVEFRYVDASDDASGTDAEDPSLERSVSIAAAATDDSIGWDDMDGVQATAQAILVHFLGEEPDQAQLEALVMDAGSEWTANAEWTLPVDELERMLEGPDVTPAQV